MALKRDFDDLSKLIYQANESLIECLQNITMEKYKIKDEASSPAQQPSIMDKIEEQMSNLSIFDKIADIDIDESVQFRITNHKLQLFTPKRKDLLFHRFKKEQQQKLVHQKAEVEKKFNPRDAMAKPTKGQFTLRNQALNKAETFPINSQDMEKLRPQTDLNDVIIGTYIKLLQFSFLPPETEHSTYIYSSFFLEKIICELVKDEVVAERDMQQLVEQVRAKVKENYKNVKRWTKKIDIFAKDMLVFPINAFRHWFCIIVNRPSCLLNNSGACEIIYCDSMFEKRQFVAEAIRKYLQYQLQDKKNIKLQVDEDNLPCYQLLLPRQTNTHDCGLYMVCYIEELLQHRNQLDNLHQISNRNKLRLFPRTLIFTMRERLRKLFLRLINAKQQKEKNDILMEYNAEKSKIMSDTQANDYDQINEKEYRKYQKMNILSASGPSPQEKCFACSIRFYLDPEINFYEKDK